jgi:hypothetical protein
MTPTTWPATPSPRWPGAAAPGPATWPPSPWSPASPARPGASCPSSWPAPGSTATPGTRSPPRWPPAPDRHSCATDPGPRPPAPGGLRLLATQRARRGRLRRSPAAAIPPPAQPQVQVERPQRSEDERPGGSAALAATIGAEEGAGNGPNDPSAYRGLHENPAQNTTCIGLDKHRSIARRDLGPRGITRCLRSVTTVPAALSPVRPVGGERQKTRAGLSFGLIHPRPAPFTGGHPDRVRAGHGRWRTPVNAGVHCWKACWGQPLRSSNLLSSATADLQEHRSSAPTGWRLELRWSQLLVSVSSVGWVPPLGFAALLRLVTGAPDGPER